MNRTRVKICGITRLEDALAAIYAGADALGFVFYPASPRYISPVKAREIIDQLPPFVTTVGLCVDMPETELRALLAQVPLSLLQFHGDETPEACASYDRPFIKAVRVKVGLDLVQYARDYQKAQGLLLDAFVAGIPGGTGQVFDWALIPPDLPLPVILAGGLNVDNIRHAIERVKPYAVDVSGGVELSKGIKDANKMNQLIKEVAHAQL